MPASGDLITYFSEITQKYETTKYEVPAHPAETRPLDAVIFAPIQEELIKKIPYVGFWLVVVGLS